MFYFYQDTIITVRPGLGENNWATVKRKPNGGWTTVKSPAMPRTDRFDTAVNNLHDWAETKGLKKADYGCCYHCHDGYCSEWKSELTPICKDLWGLMAYKRCPRCITMGFVKDHN